MMGETTGTNMTAVSQGKALFDEGDQAWRHGDFMTAILRLEQSLKLFQEHGEHIGVLRAQHFLANVAYSQGDYALARARHEQVLQQCRDLGLVEGVASSLNNLGLVAMQQRDYQTGRALMQESLRLYRELEMEQSITAVLHNLGGLAQHEGDAASAHTWFAQSLTRSREAGDTSFMARNLGALANLADQRGEHIWAARLWSMAETLDEQPSTALPNPDQPVDSREIVAARKVLGEEAFTAAWKEGRGMQLEQVLEHVLQGMGSSDRRPADAARTR